MQQLKDILTNVGYFTTAYVILLFTWKLIQWFRGVSPAIQRLGKGLAHRKVALFAKGEDYEALKALLIESGLFTKKNIIKINSSDIDKASSYSLFLVHWKSFEDQWSTILKLKSDSTGLIVYAVL